MARLGSLPNEVLHMIAIRLTEGCEEDFYEQRQVERALAALSLTSRLFHQIFDLPLYEWNRDCKRQFLSWAIQNRSFRHMEKALALGHDLDSVTFAAFPDNVFYDELRPLQVAVKCGHNDVLKWLLERGANPDPGSSTKSDMPDTREAVDIESSALHMALHETQNEEAVHMLLDHDAKVYFAKPTGLSRGTGQGRRLVPQTTALHLAAGSGMVGVVERLLDVLRGNTVEVDYMDESRITALHHCALLKRSRKDILEILLRHGADATVEDLYGSSALHSTLLDGHMDNVLTLIQVVADAASLEHPWGFEPWTYSNLCSYIGALDSRIEDFEFLGPLEPEEEIKTILAKFIELGADFNDPPGEDSDDEWDAPEQAPIVFFTVPVARDNIIGRPEFEPIILNALLELGVVFEGKGGAAKAEHESLWRL